MTCKTILAIAAALFAFGHPAQAENPEDLTAPVTAEQMRDVALWQCRHAHATGELAVTLSGCIGAAIAYSDAELLNQCQGEQERSCIHWRNMALYGRFGIAELYMNRGEEV